MINELLERFAKLDGIVHFQSGLLGVIASLSVTNPLSKFHRWQGVDRKVQAVN